MVRDDSRRCGIGERDECTLDAAAATQLPCRRSSRLHTTPVIQSKSQAQFILRVATQDRMSLRLTPAAGHASTTTSSSTLAPSAPVHDTMRAGPQSLASKHNNRHPLESRLENWEQTQQDLKYETMRRIYGVAEPVRRGMELSLCREGARHTGFGMEDGIGSDILRGTDCSLDVKDIWSGREMARGGGYQETMEKRMRRGL